MRSSHQVQAYALLRVALGVNMFGHGFFRILTGVAAFATGMSQGMGKGPLPHLLTVGFGYCVPWLELVLGVLLIAGLLTRTALVGGAVFMVTLTFGTTSVQNWNGAGTQLQYSFIFFVLLWLLRANTLSVDHLLLRRTV